MLIKKIPEQGPSYWERVWEGLKADACREVVPTRFLLEGDYGIYAGAKASTIPKHNRCYGIGCPARYFNTSMDAQSGCIHDCKECWESEWQGEEFR